MFTFRRRTRCSLRCFGVGCKASWNVRLCFFLHGRTFFPDVRVHSWWSPLSRQRRPSPSFLSLPPPPSIISSLCLLITARHTASNPSPAPRRSQVHDECDVGRQRPVVHRGRLPGEPQAGGHRAQQGARVGEGRSIVGGGRGEGRVFGRASLTAAVWQKMNLFYQNKRNAFTVLAFLIREPFAGKQFNMRGGTCESCLSSRVLSMLLLDIIYMP